MSSQSQILSAFLLTLLAFSFSSCKPEYEAVMIESVILKKFPTQNNGGNWDLNSSADPYIAIYSEGTKLHATSSHTDAEISQNQAYLDIGLIINDFSKPMEIRVLDEDAFFDDQLMGSVNFNLNEGERTITKSNPQIEVEIKVNWIEK